MKPAAQQLTLSLYTPLSAAFGEFVGATNRAALVSVETWAGVGGPWCVGLWGSPGTGKTHLLQAAIRQAHDAGRAAMYVPLREVMPHGPRVLDDLEHIRALALDDLETIAGNIIWETAVFALYNRVQAHDSRLLFATNLPLAALPLTLPDLKSRLNAALLFQLHGLTDDEKLQVLQYAARARGMELSEPVASFLLRRLPRELPQLLQAIETLDGASLQASRALTIPFVREVLDLQ